MMAPDNLPLQSPRPSPLSWAVYLGASWTWCIGMFLPVLLMRDYGIAGWAVFAVPNVCGAAAMGWVLARPGVSERLVAGHRTACVAFSAVTLAFHGFFLIWLAGLFIPAPAAVAAMTIGSLLAIVANRRIALDVAVAWGVMAFSFVVLILGLTHLRVPDVHGLRPAADLVWLAPVCVFGFALCPYLDLTFHRAKQGTSPDGGLIAFGLGFGVFFFSMIVLTVLYEGDMLYEGMGSFGTVGLRSWVAAYLCAQIGFTCAAHLRALPRTVFSGDIGIWIAAAAMAVVGGVMARSPTLHLPARMTSLVTGEVVYRVFMAFYGLIFPAYVWTCMVPLGHSAPGPTPRALAACGVAVALASPFFFVGFIGQYTIWLLPGVAIAMSGRAFAGGGIRRSSTTEATGFAAKV